MENTLIERINKVLIKNKLNMAQFAGRIEFDQKTVHNYLKGKRKASLEFVESTISTFGLDANWVLFGKGRPKAREFVDSFETDEPQVDYKEKWIELLQQNNELLIRITEYQDREIVLENSRGGAVANVRAAKVG